MTLTNSLTTSFFEDADIIILWNNTMAKLQEKGIKDVDDFEMVDKDI